MNSTAARTCASLSEALPPLGGIAPFPFRTDCTSESMPVLMRGAQAALSPSFGEPATDCMWQAMQVWLYTALPSAAAGFSAACAAGCVAAVAAGCVAAAEAGLDAAGALNFAPASFAMATTARAISSSVSEGSPAFGGMAPLPFTTEATSAFSPCLIRGAHCALSPSLGAFATPAWWQAVQTALTIS